MAGKYFSKKGKDDFYLPGEEIKIDKSSSFKSFSCEKDPVSVCKNRVLAALLGFIAVYTIIAARLFDLCIIPNLHFSSEADDASPGIYAQNPIRRADIIDRNGTIIATSLPTVNLYANPRKVLNPKKAAEELCNEISRIFTFINGYVTVIFNSKSEEHFVERIKHIFNNVIACFSVF